MPGKQQYGTRGQEWHPDFVQYIEWLARHPVYEGMPDAFVDGGRVQWEAPSNRSGGRFQDTHHKRRQWWKDKARILGIDTASAQWISRTAKKLHPTGRKPCKRCGRELELRYVYPREILKDRIRRLGSVGAEFEFPDLESPLLS